MRLPRGLVVSVAFVALPTCLAAQASYEPSYEPPLGDELVAVFVSSSTCIANHDPEFDDAVRRMKSLLAAEAEELGRPFSVVGVAADWEPQVGIDYLMNGVWKGGTLNFGLWDEVVAGRNWGNSAAVRYLQELSPEGCPEPEGLRLAVPQLFLIERRAHDWRADGNFAYGPERLLLQLCGGDRIIEWVRDGAPLPAGPKTGR